MNFEIPLYKQEKSNSCALASLRMVLAAYGSHVDEGVLASQAQMGPKGVMISELERLAREFGLSAEIQIATVEQLEGILAAGQLAIAFIDRAIFDLKPAEWRNHRLLEAIIHTVIPIRMSAKSVTFHDPRLPAVVRKSVRDFRRAYEGLGGNCVVCSMPSVSQ